MTPWRADIWMLETMTGTQYQILFVGGHDASFSAMAAAFANTHGRKDVRVHYAGMHSGHVDPLAWRVLSEFQVSPRAQEGLVLSSLGAVIPDVVVSLAAESEPACAVLVGNPQQLHWRLDESAGMGDDLERQLKRFHESCGTLKRLVDDLFGRGYLDAFLQARRVSNLVLDHISEGVIAHDLKRRIFYFNAAAEVITGYKREDVLNRDCHEVIPGGLCGGKCAFCKGGVLPKMPVAKDVEITTAGGEPRRISMNVNFMSGQEGKPVGILACFRDMTRETQLARRLGEIEQFAGIVGKHPAMLALYDLIPELAESAAPVLIQGESGTGKELVAAALHNEGPRANKMFVPVNCGALPEGLLESELFGHMKGSFTGAIRDKKGRFELADGGTIFLDEIGDIAPKVQVE
ncbi:MAG: sigma 54-interacting transcriptional regulator, partial [bacterium]